jgi:fatty-acyl-CoA synthase
MARQAHPNTAGTVGQLLRQAAAEYPDVLAVREGLAPGRPVRSWSYAELLADAERVARALLTIVEPGERVALWANNLPEWLLVQFGTALAGVTLVTVNPALGFEETGYVLGHSGAVAVFHADRYRDFDMAAALQNLRYALPKLRHSISLGRLWQWCDRGGRTTPLPPVSPADIAQIQYTSGTTGRPKGAALRHLGLTHTARFVADRLGLGCGDTLVHAMPLFHAGGSVLITLGCIQARGANILLPNFDAAAQLALIETEHSAVVAGVPTMLRAMLSHPTFRTTDTSSVRFALTGGATVEPAFAREVEERLGVPLCVVYGQTETSAMITMTTPADTAADRISSVGRPIPDVEVRIADIDRPRADCAIGEVGEICTRGPHVMAGYHGHDDRAGSVVDSEQWLHTGDLGSLDERGYLSIRGRLKDMVIVGGENIYPAEIEGALVAHPAVAEAAVVGVPDEYWGENLVGFVRLVEGASCSPEDMQRFLATSLASHKIPRQWSIVESFPLNASGKILKTELQLRYDRELNGR